MSNTRAIRYFLPAIFILTTLVYLAGLNGVFLYDDYGQIVTRTRLHQLSNLHDVIFCGLRQNRVWQNLSFALNWTISPGQTWSFKLFSLILHLLNGSLLFLWLKRLFADKPYLPILATSLFLVHPLQIQSVTYVMGVIMLFFGFFMLLSLYWFSKYSLTRMPGLIMILVASLLARETCVLIPFILLIYDLMINKTKIRELPKLKWLILFAIPFLYIPLNAYLSDPGKSMYAGVGGFNLYPFWKHLATQLYFQSFYLSLFINPTLQSILHSNPSIDANMIIGAILGGSIWLLGMAFIALKNQKFPRIAFFAFFFFINYLPTNSFLQLINPFAEYRLYISNISLCILLAYGIHAFGKWLTRKTKLTMAEISVSAIVFSFFTIFTLQNVMIWKNWELIFAQAIKRYPSNEYLYIGLGIEYQHADDLKNAYSSFYQSRMLSGWLNTDLAYLFYMTAAAYYQKGDYQNAWEIVEKMDQEQNKDPLPDNFYKFKNELQQKMR